MTTHHTPGEPDERHPRNVPRRTRTGGERRRDAGGRRAARRDGGADLIAGPAQPTAADSTTTWSVATPDDDAFRLMLADPGMQSVVRAFAAESRRRDVIRIASTLFCTEGIDPTVVTFAKHRTADHWGLDEEHLDVLIAARLLDKAARLTADLRDLGHAEPALAAAA